MTTTTTTAARKGPTFDIKGRRGINIATNTHKKINHSFFACLLNTNFKPRDREQLQIFGEEYPDILETLLNGNDTLLKDSITIVDNITTLPDGRKTFVTHKISDEDYNTHIKHVRSRFKVEVGNNYGKGGRLHIHASFFIIHTTKIQLDLGPIVKAFNEELEARSMPTIKYFHVKSEKPSTDLYMSKYNYA